MKTSKKMLTVVLGAALIAGLLPVSSYSKPKKGQKSAIQQLQDFFAKEEAAEKKAAEKKAAEKEVAVSAATEKKETPADVSDDNTSNNTATSGQEQQTAPEIMKKTFVCGKETITVEYGDGEKAVLTNGKGKTFELVNTKAASGELYSNKEGVSIHMKGNDGVYTSSSKAKDVSCELSK